MPNFNRFVVAGHLGSKPELRQVNDTHVATASLANKTGWGEHEKTTWFKLEVWGKRGEAFTQYLDKGNPVLVEGQMVCDEYDKDGEKKYMWKVKVDNFTFLGGKSDAGSGQDDDLPY